MSKQILNLDELFGQHKEVVILWEGQRHTLRHPTEMGPEDLLRFQRLQEQQAALAAGDVSAASLERVVDDIIQLIGPSLADAGLPFFAKMRVLTFYQQQLEADLPKGAAGAEGPSTGATSTAP